MFTGLNSHNKSLSGRVFYLEEKPLAIEKLLFEAIKFVSTQQDKVTAEAKVLKVKKCCLDFRLEAVTQVEKHSPAAHSKSLIQSVAAFSFMRREKQRNRGTV